MGFYACDKYDSSRPPELLRPAGQEEGNWQILKRDSIRCETPELTLYRNCTAPE
jgi:hypothetical protein